MPVSKIYTLNTLKAFESKVPRRIFGFIPEEVKG
jgi:hypothetical protein